jgi:hypothetical protein
LAFELLQQDLRAAALALEQDDYENMNIFANRIMSDGAILSDKKFLLIGFLAKDVAVEMIELTTTRKPSALATAKAHANMLVSRMKAYATQEGFARQDIWKDYVDFCDRIRKFHLMPIEEKAYTDDKDLTKQVAAWVLDCLQRNQDSLLDPKNQLLKGLLNELGRTYRVHGAEEREITLLSLLTALDRLYDYARFASEGPGGSLEAAKIKQMIFPWVEKILQEMRDGAGDSTAATDLLCELIVKWREAFVNYMELRYPVSVPVEKGVQLPEETKKRIAEAVTKALQVKEETKKQQK